MGRRASYEQRLKELQKETERVRKDMRQVSKELRKTGLTADDIAPPRRATPSRSAAPAVRAATPTFTSPMATTATAHDAPPERTGSPAAGQAVEEDADYAGLPSAATRTIATQRSAAPPDRKLVSFLASGSFGKSVPLTRERRVMRNRAIFMLAFVVLVALLMYHFIF